MLYSRENLQNNPILNPSHLEQLLGPYHSLGVYYIILQHLNDLRALCSTGISHLFCFWSVMV